MPYLVQCWNCLGEFDAIEAVWCGDSSTHPTKVCPFCLQCFCTATPAYQEQFWAKAPDSLLHEIKTLNESKQRIGDILVRAGLLTPEELLRALEVQKTTRKRLGEILVEQGRVKPSALNELLQKQQAVVTADLHRAHISPELIREVGVDLCYDRKILPLSKDQVGERPHLTLAMADPGDGRTLDEVQGKTGCRVIGEAASAEEILGLLRNLFPRAADAGILEETPDQVHQQIMDLLRAAVRRRATVIHVESRQTELWVFFRIDGQLYRVKRLPKRIRYLVLDELRTIVRQPPDGPLRHGRTFLQIGEGRYALSVEVQEGDQGENALIRLVDVALYGRSIDEAVGGPPASIALQAAFRRRKGLVLVTAPLFHGRREALYACMGALRDAGRTPVLLEGLMACPIPGVRQYEMETGEAMSRLVQFLEAPPASLGIADLPAAAIAKLAMQIAAKTTVVATLRSSSASRALLQLLEWGLPGLDLSEVLLVVTNQRQVRRLCPACLVSDTAAKETVYLGMSADEISRMHPRRSVGCTECQRLGSLGRVTVSESLIVDDGIRALIAAEAAPEVIHTTAVERGMVPLREAFLQRVRDGVISLEEVVKAAV